MLHRVFTPFAFFRENFPEIPLFPALLLEKLLDGLIIRGKNKKHYSDVVLMRFSVFARKIWIYETKKFEKL